MHISMRVTLRLDVSMLPNSSLIRLSLYAAIYFPAYGQNHVATAVNLL
jgi:hypothetical protein